MWDENQGLVEQDKYMTSINQYRQKQYDREGVIG